MGSDIRTASKEVVHVTAKRNNNGLSLLSVAKQGKRLNPRAVLVQRTLFCVGLSNHEVGQKLYCCLLAGLRVIQYERIT